MVPKAIDWLRDSNRRFSNLYIYNSTDSKRVKEKVIFSL